MFKIKKYRKESTDPAQLVESVEQAARQAKENLAWLIAGVVVAVLAGAAVGGFLWMRQQDDRAAADLLYEATQQASEPSQTGAPPAAYLLGNALSERKDWDGAIKAYQDFLARHGANRLLVPLVYQRMAYVQLAQGKLDEAEKTLTAIAQMASAPNKDHALYELGKINELLNRPEGALAYYQQIVKDHPSSPFATEASVRIKTLDARKAAPPQASPSAPPPAPTQK